MKQVLINILKMAVSGSLIVYLVMSGKLNFADLKIYLEQPLILVFAIFQWGILFVLAGSFRWYLLLRGLSLPVRYFDVVRLQLIGLFFNAVMPGSVGGDLIKGVYVVREQTSAGKTTAMLSILVDRVIGLMGLFLFAGLVVAANFSFVWDSEALRPLVYVVYGIMIATVGGFILVLVPHEDRDPIGDFLMRPVLGFSLLKKIYSAMRCFREHPSKLIYALFLSVAIQASLMCFFWVVARALTGLDVDLGGLATVFPIGALAVAIPIAPAGLGVGHMAFENLFQMIGVSDGANIFNVVTLGILSLNLIGVIPYLSHRSEMKTHDPLASEGT